MHALVTGGGGFLGRYIVEKLRDRGDRVRVFARGHYPELEEIDCHCIRGDLRSPQDVDAACRDIDVVFHTAALAGFWGRRRLYEAINVDGTANVIRSCRTHHVPKLVYTSSPSVVFGMASLEDIAETCPYPDKYYSWYSWSKARAERMVLAANSENGPATCSLRPHLIWGPRDTHIVPLIVARARAGQLVQIGEGTNMIDINYVENSADAHLLAADALAADAAVAGQAYFIADRQPVNMWQWINELLARMDLPRVEKRISYRTAYAVGFGLECLYRVLPFLGEPRLTRFLVSHFAMSHYFDLSKAKRDLDYTGRVSNEEGLRRTVEWAKGTCSR